jgi:anti-anti-sigma regulatory factor
VKRKKEFRVEVSERVPLCLVIELIGDFTRQGGANSRQVERVVWKYGEGVVYVIDLFKTGDIDADGIATLVGLYVRTHGFYPEQIDTRLSVWNPSQELVARIQAMGLSNFFEFTYN